MLPDNADSKAVYSRKDVVELYAHADYLSGAEKALFSRYLKPGLRILDIGVGGGRTSAILAENAAQYIGIDYVPAMVEACRQRFPRLQFEVMDAADLSAFADGHFDLVVFSFNGLGYLHPDGQRRQCLLECRRILKNGGIFIFSLHHARSLFLRPPLRQGLDSLLASLWQSAKRCVVRIRQKLFWQGGGYFFSDAHGGLLVYLATPATVKTQLTQAGFTMLDVLGDAYPAFNISCMTLWYYYSARK